MKLQDNFILNSKFILPLAMLYICLNITADVVSFRFYNYSNFPLSASALIYPITFFISDSIAEVYGYSMARKIIWVGLICEVIFAVLIEILIRLPLQSSLANQQAFFITLGPMLKFILSCIVGDLAGIFLNIYCISKWKILLKGRFFWLRSILSTTFGELSMTFICTLLGFWGYNNILANLKIALSTYFLLVIYAMILVWPTYFFTLILKRVEKIDVYDTDTNFNPFKI